MQKITSMLAVLSCLIFGTNCTKKDNYTAYQTLSQEKVGAIGSEVVQLKHQKSGAHVVLIKNDDPARSFMVGFRTPPYDDTGLFHIFEHAVLEGSRLYPSKSNFFHLANSSVASFINAMTGPVYTLYPYVTRSDKDFDNLLSVYMDAVFFPNVLEDPRIIKREGWRYEVDPDSKKMSINGIVLSEMKGAYSSPYRVLWSELATALVPDTPYAFSSGGLPHKVSTLTFEQIRDAHKKYYHPQNSVIYLYGDIDYKKALNTIDQTFLKEFSATKDFQSPAIPTQKDFNYPTPLVDKTYPGEAKPNKDFVAKGFVLGQGLSSVEESAASVLTQAFIENNAAPLKLRMQQEGLAQSTFKMGVGGQENALALVFEGSNGKQKDRIEQVLNEEIEKVVQDGLDPELLTSILNKYEFAFKEKNSNGSHKGMQLGSIVLDNWINQDEPLNEALDFVTHFKKLRLLLSDQEYVKSFFKNYFKNNQKVRWVVLRPDPNFSQEFNSKLDEQIQQALKQRPVDEYLKEHLKYEEWVAAKEPKEIIDKVPTLELSDIKTNDTPIESTRSTIGNTELIEYPQNTTGINYLKLYFDLSGVEESNLKNLELLTSLIKRTDTKNYSFKDLSKEIDTYIGGLGFGVSSFQSVVNPDQFKPTLVVSLRFINENRDKAIALTQELLQNSLFAPNKRVKDLINEMKTSMTSGISYRAPSLSILAATNRFFPNLGAFNEATSGGPFEKYILQTEIQPSVLVPELKKMSQQIFNRNRLYLATITSDAADITPLKRSINQIKESLPKGNTSNQNWAFGDQTRYDGYAIPGEVQYVAQATSYRKHGLSYHGSMDVYSRYLNNNYMTPKLREQAGAYGGRAAFGRNGLFTMSTYRDPNLKRSLDIFSQAIDFMGSENFDADNLRPAILGSLKTYYSDQSVYDKTNFMTGLYLTDQSWQDYMQTKEEILQTTAEDMGRITQVLGKALGESSKGVAGNSEKLKAEATFLKNILSIQ
jgi:presequence protease